MQQILVEFLLIRLNRDLRFLFSNNTWLFLHTLDTLAIDALFSVGASICVCLVVIERICIGINL